MRVYHTFVNVVFERVLTIQSSYESQRFPIEFDLAQKCFCSFVMHVAQGPQCISFDPETAVSVNHTPYCTNSALRTRRPQQSVIILILDGFSKYEMIKLFTEKQPESRTRISGVFFFFTSSSVAVSIQRRLLHRCRDLRPLCYHCTRTHYCYYYYVYSLEYYIGDVRTKRVADTYYHTQGVRR